MLWPNHSAFGTDIRVLILALLLRGPLPAHRVHALVFITGRTMFIKCSLGPYSHEVAEMLCNLYNEGVVQCVGTDYSLTDVGVSFARQYANLLPGLTEWADKLLSMEEAHFDVVNQVCTKTRYGDVVVFLNPIEP